MRIALGSTAFEPGVLGGILKVRLKPNFNHSCVTPTHAVPAAFRYSTRIHGPVIAVGVAGLVVSSSINGIEAQALRPESVYGFPQPFVPGVANPGYSVPPAVSVIAPAVKGPPV